MGNLWNREPALVVGFVQAVITAAVAFGLELTAEQTGAILLVTAAALSLVVRRKVSPTGDTLPPPPPESVSE